MPFDPSLLEPVQQGFNPALLEPVGGPPVLNRFQSRLAEDRAAQQLPVGGVLGDAWKSLTQPITGQDIQRVQGYSPASLVNKPTNTAEGVAYAGLQQLNPLNAALAAAGGIGLLGKLGILGKAVATGGFAGVGAEATGQGLGQLTSGAPMTPEVKGNAIVNSLTGPLMMAASFADLIPKAPVQGSIRGISMNPSDAPPGQNWVNPNLSRSPIPPKPAPSAGLESASKPTTTGFFDKGKLFPINVSAPQETGTAKLGGQSNPPSSVPTEDDLAKLFAAGWDKSRQTGSVRPVRTLMDAGFAGIRHDVLPWLTKEQQQQVVNNYISGGDFGDIENLANTLKNQNIEQRKQNANQQRSGVLPTEQSNAQEVRQGQKENVQQGEDVRKGTPQGSSQTAPKEQIPGAASVPNRTGSRVDVKPQLTDAEKDILKNLDFGEGRTKESGFVIAPKEVWDKIWSNKTTPIDPTQMFNRIKNVFGEGSATFKALQAAGLGNFLSQKRTTQEVENWAEQNAPKVEVRKFGDGSAQTPEQKRFAELVHYFDGLPAAQRGVANHYLTYLDEESLNNLKNLNPEAAKLAPEYNSLNKKGLQEGVEKSHWQSVAPKSEKDMPGYVEIAVVKPLEKMSQKHYDSLDDSTKFMTRTGTPLPKFPSSHNFPPNTLGFVRGYMENVGGKKVFHVIEVQSDWAQQRREAVERNKEFVQRNQARGVPDDALRNERHQVADDPLLPHYERLALKAAIDHARSEGADAIAISDAETAMMTEGHDRVVTMEKHFDNAKEADNYVASSSGRFAKLTGDGKTVRIEEPTNGYVESNIKDGWKIIGPTQQEGMRLHYDRTLPKIAEELTGSKGERMSLGEHKMAYNAQQGHTGFAVFRNGERVNDQTWPTREDASEVAKKGDEVRELKGARKDLIFRNEKGEPKTDVTANVFDISGKNKTLPKEFSLYGKSGAVFPTPKGSGTPKTLAQLRQQQVGPLEQLRDKLVASIKTDKPKGDIIRFKDAADNMARLLGARARKGLEGIVKRDFGTSSDKALNAVTAAIEANGDVKKLDGFIATAKAKNDARGLVAATFAKANWDRLQPLVKEVNQYHATELAEERGAGLDTTEREGYVKHAYDVAKIPDSLVDKFFGSSGGGDKGFLKQRVFPTLYDAIEQGYGSAIKSWNAANLVENRLATGGQMVNDVKWLDGLHDLKDPTTKLPIVTRLIKRVNPKTGDTDLVPPRGYETWSPFPGRSFAVHRGYRNIFDSITSLSHTRQWELKGLPIGQALMKGVGGLKHSMLVFDSYHAMRMFTKGLALGVRGYGKGLSLLEYNDKDLSTALKNGDITQDAYDYAKQNRPIAEKLIRGGLNVGRIQEGLDSEVITDLMPLIGRWVGTKLGGELGGNYGEWSAEIPAKVNRWIFEKLTRGIMMDAGVREYTRLRGEGLSDEVATKQVVKEINTNFGNLGRQGIFRSKTSQDLSKLIFLAPQWVESMVRTEMGATVGAGKYVGQGINYALLKSANPKVKPPIAGTLLRGTANLIFWTFVATQVANLASRGKPTWDNPEEGHKLDAWIPGGQNGFWVSPLSLPMEITHDIVRYAAKDESPLSIAAQIGGNKLSPLARAGSVLATGRDYTGAKLPDDVSRVKTAVENLMPLPLPLQPLVKGGYPGQVQRQLMASAGVKAEPVSSPRTIVNNLRNQYAYKIGKSQQPEFTPSEHLPLIQALQNNDVAAATVEYDKLLTLQIQKHTDDPDPVHEAKMDLQKFFKEYEKSNGKLDKNQEAVFEKTLTYHQQQLLQQVKDQQKAVSDLFFSQIQSDQSNAPRGFRPPRLRRLR